MATINLAPGTQYLAALRRRRRNLYGAAIAVVFCAAVIWIVLLAVLSSTARQAEAAEETLASLERQLAESQPNATRVSLFEERLSAVQLLLASHVSTLPLLAEVERLLPPPVTLNTLSFDTEAGKLDMSGVAPDIDTVAQAVASLKADPTRKTMFTTVELSGITRQEEKGADGTPGPVSYSFNLGLTFNPGLIRTASGTQL